MPHERATLVPNAPARQPFRSPAGYNGAVRWADLSAVPGGDLPVCWIAEPEVAALPLTERLLADLRAWQAAYDGSPGQAFAAEGRRLLAALRRELGPSWVVTGDRYGGDEAPGYRNVPERLRREVARLARQGTRHPNRLVAAAAEAWAREVLAASRWDVAYETFVAPVLAMSTPTEEGLQPWWGSRVRARRILRASS